jgi:tetratricopeptide (TPR) repeat protein
VKRVLEAALLAASISIAAGQAPRDALAQVNAALQAGEADKALAMLSSLPASAETHNLRCRVLFTLDHWDEAANECEQAVRIDGHNSDDHLWLGRALGEKADKASLLSAYSLAKRTRAEFEESVRLNPRNAQALADLGEFYSEAPGVVGGGADKAAGIANQLEKVDAARAHELRARLADINKDYATAEREFKEAISVSEHPAFQWMTLGNFYRRRERWSEMQAAVETGYKAAQRDKQAGVALFNGASILSRGGRNLELAVRMFEEYLADNQKTEEAPAFVAATRLARLKAQLGDVEGARRARNAALALAHDYKPALGLTF